MIASLPIMLKHFIPDHKPRNPYRPERKLSDHTFHDYDVTANQDLVHIL